MISYLQTEMKRFLARFVLTTVISKVDKKGNDQEVIHSNPHPVPKHQMGKEHVRLKATTGIIKNKEFIDLRKIICSRKCVPLTFQN